MKKILFIFLILSSCSGANEDSFRDKLELTDLTGQTVDISGFDNQYLIVNFWATWCRPCLREMPSLRALENQLADLPVEIIFVSNEDPEHVSGFLQSKELGIESMIMPSAVETYELLYLPTTYLVSPDGKVLMKEEGEREWNEESMVKRIRSMIKA